MMMLEENSDFLLQEVSQYAPAKLRELEGYFAQLKKSFKDKDAVKNIIMTIKEFFKLKDVVFTLNNEFNGGVITIYKTSAATNFTDKVMEYFGGKDFSEKPIPNSILKNLKEVQEPATAIERVYIFIGRPLLRILTPAEMVAVILHEFGHVFAVTSNIPYRVLALTKKLLHAAFPASMLLQLYGIIINFYMVYALLTLGLIYGITFSMRTSEKVSDRYTLKYGYADELIGAINKLGPAKKRNKSWLDKIKIVLNYFGDLFRLVTDPREHPSNIARIKNLEDRIFDDYRKTYPEYKDMLNIIQSDYQKQSKPEVVAS